MEKHLQVLLKFLKTVEASPPQRSEEWYKIRQCTIGGSEISTVIGVNPYSTVQDLIANKLGISTFNGNKATRWGNLFEHVTEKWCEVVFTLANGVQEAGSIKGIIDNQRYSPDGLSVMRLRNYNNKPEWYIILFEFKAPLGTLPNGKIPAHYRPQVQTGLMSIPICDYGVFVNNCYRKCSLGDFEYNGMYDKKFHAGDYKKRKYGLEKETPYACGIICFYQTIDEYDKLYEFHGDGISDDEYDINDAFDEKSNAGDAKFPPDYFRVGDMELLGGIDNLHDLGDIDSATFERVLELHDQKRLKAMYYPICANHKHVATLPFIETHGLYKVKSNTPLKKFASACIDKFINTCESHGMVPVGFLPWKLMRSDILLEERDPDWERKIKDPVLNTLSIMQKIMNSPNPKLSYYEHFPSVDKDDLDFLAEANDEAISFFENTNNEDIEDGCNTGCK